MSNPLAGILVLLLLVALLVLLHYFFPSPAVKVEELQEVKEVEQVDQVDQVEQVEPQTAIAAEEVMARYIHRRFSRRSYTSLDGVAPPLAAVITLALVTADHDFVVIEGVRTKQRQAALVTAKRSWTMDSQHLTGRAIDIAVLDADGNISWDPQLYVDVQPAFEAAAKQLGVPLVWGGDWSVRDFGHYELPDSYDWKLH